MKKYFSTAFTILLATVAVSFAGPADKDAIIAKEKAAWQAFKDKSADGFKKLISANLVAVYAEGIMNMTQELDAMSKTEMKSVTFGEFNVSMPEANTAIVTYQATTVSSFAGKDNSGTYNCGSVWQQKDGQWQGVFHTDTKAEPAAAGDAAHKNE